MGSEGCGLWPRPRVSSWHWCLLERPQPISVSLSVTQSVCVSAHPAARPCIHSLPCAHPAVHPCAHPRACPPTVQPRPHRRSRPPTHAPRGWFTRPSHPAPRPSDFPPVRPHRLAGTTSAQCGGPELKATRGPLQILRTILSLIIRFVSFLKNNVLFSDCESSICSLRETWPRRMSELTFRYFLPASSRVLTHFAELDFSE